MSVAGTWKANKEAIPESQKFDWTYSTPYRGCATKDASRWLPEATDLQIDFESLKVCAVRTRVRVRVRTRVCAYVCVCARVCARCVPPRAQGERETYRVFDEGVF